MPREGMITSAARVMATLMVSIMTITPATMVTEVTICIRLWLSVWVMVSTSLVTCESTSPWLCRRRSAGQCG